MAAVPGGGAGRMVLDAVGQCVAAVWSSFLRLLGRRWSSFRGVAGAIVVRGRAAGFAADLFPPSSKRFAVTTTSDATNRNDLIARASGRWCF
jgi:hypothetical protein